jgi:hypothetical protein
LSRADKSPKGDPLERKLLLAAKQILDNPPGSPRRPCLKRQKPPDVEPAIREADDLIDEAVSHLVAIDRELAALQAGLRRRSTADLREEIALVRERRECRDLITLLELADMLTEFMGRA